MIPPSSAKIISSVVHFVTGVILLDLSFTLPEQYMAPIGSVLRLLAVWGLYGVSFTYIFAAVLGLDGERFSRRLVIITLVVLLVAFYCAFFRRTGIENLGTDGILFSRYGVDLVLAGENPYAHSMADAIERYPLDEASVTYTADGGSVQSLSYPALSVLPFIPQALLGIENPNLTAIVVFFLVTLFLVRASPSFLASAPLALMFGNLNLLRFTYGGVFDILWVLPLLFAMRAWTRQRWAMAAVFFGLACGVKQTPWLIAPFLGVWLYLESPDHREFRRRAGITLGYGFGAFLLPNLPFIVADPGSWLRGVLVPLGSASPLVMQGSGAVLLESSGVAAMPYGFFTALSLLVLAGSLAIYLLYFERLRWLAWIAPMFITWFHARSLQNYFIFFVPLAYYAWLLRGGHARAAPQAASEQPNPEPPPTVVWHAALGPAIRARLALGVLVAVVSGTFAAAAVSRGGSRVELEVALAGAFDPERLDRASELDLRLTNEDALPFRPVFDVVREGQSTRFAWKVVSGPAVLGAGESATYRIRAPAAVAALRYGQEFGVTVKDRDSSRVVKSAPLILERLAAEPVRIANPRFTAWESPSREVGLRPFGWRATTNGEPGEETVVRRIAEGVRLEAGNVHRTASGPWCMAGLGQEIAHPPRLAIELTAASVLPRPDVTPAVVTGLEIADGDRRVWIVPTAVATQETRVRPGSLDYVFVFVPAEPGKRIRTIVDVAAVYRSQGWPIPETVTGSDKRFASVHLLLFAAVYPGPRASGGHAEIVFHSVEALDAAAAPVERR